MGEDLLPRDAGGLRQLFHPAQDAAAVDGSAAAGDEDAPVRDALFPAVLAELSAEGTVDEDGAGLAFEGDGGAAGGEGGDCDEGQFADADPGACQGLHDEGELVSPGLASAGPVLRGPDQVLVLSDREVFLRAAECGALGLEDHDHTVLPAHVLEEGVQGGQHGVGAGEHVVVFQVLFEPAHLLLVHGKCDVRLSVQCVCRAEPCQEGPHVPRVLVNGGKALLMVAKESCELQDHVFRDHVRLRGVLCTPVVFHVDDHSVSSG